jgi:hypothetical protein
MRGPTKPLAVFYHVAHIGERWQSIDREISNALAASGLMECVDLFVRNDCRRGELFEFPTIDMLREFSFNNDYYVLYLHTKGVTQPIQSVDDWRACMLYWIVERWRECVEKLDEGRDAVGINHMASPVRHFQGNFWWAKTQLIRNLGRVQDVQYKPTHTNQTERHKAEFWLLGKGANAYEPYHHRIDPYCTRNPRANYVGRQFL